MVRPKPVPPNLRVVEKAPHECAALEHPLTESANGVVSSVGQTDHLEHLGDHRSLVELLRWSDQDVGDLAQLVGDLHAHQRGIVERQDRHPVASVLRQGDAQALGDLRDGQRRVLRDVLAQAEGAIDPGAPPDHQRHVPGRARLEHLIAETIPCFEQ